MPQPKIVVITGAASGIGAATARLFADQGHHLVLLDVAFESPRPTSNDENDASALRLKVDVSQAQEVKTAIDHIITTLGQIDVLVNNAGVGTKEFVKTEHHDIDDWQRVIAINQTSVFYCMKYVLQQMTRQGFGNIINVASLAGLKASGYNLAYSASKFAVVGMTKSAALEYGSQNIRINCVCPGYTESPLLESLFTMKPKLKKRLLQATPMGRYGQPEEIAEAILWLASENSKYITGQSIVIDGGLSL
jgi:NAD(P)-dependent dehydrogenase (short-subunit alcohol dehydrogenase family)